MLAGPASGELYQLAERVGLQRRRRHQDEGRFGGFADASQILSRLVGPGSRPGQRPRQAPPPPDMLDCQSVLALDLAIASTPIKCCRRRTSCDNGLAQKFFQRRLHRTRDRVGGAARREWNDKAKGAVREGLRRNVDHRSRAGCNAQTGRDEQDQSQRWNCTRAPGRFARNHSAACEIGQPCYLLRIASILNAI